MTTEIPILKSQVHKKYEEPQNSTTFTAVDFIAQ